MTFANSLDSDQARQNFWLALDPNCLTLMVFLIFFYMKICYLTLDLEVKVTQVQVTQNVTQYHWHHVAYSPAKFEVDTSNSLGEDAFTRKYIIWPWHQGHTILYIMWPMLLKVWSCYVQQFRTYIYKKIHSLTLGSMSSEVAHNPRHHVMYSPAKLLCPTV